MIKMSTHTPQEICILGFFLMLPNVTVKKLCWQSPFKIKIISAGLTESGTIVYCQFNYLK